MAKRKKRARRVQANRKAGESRQAVGTVKVYGVPWSGEDVQELLIKYEAALREVQFYRDAVTRANHTASDLSRDAKALTAQITARLQHLAHEIDMQLATYRTERSICVAKPADFIAAVRSESADEPAEVQPKPAKPKRRGRR